MSTFKLKKTQTVFYISRASQYGMFVGLFITFLEVGLVTEIDVTCHYCKSKLKQIRGGCANFFN